MPRGQLRPATSDDLDSLVRLLHDEEVRRHLCDDALLPRETVAEILRRSERLDSRGLGLWVIEDMRERFAGIVGLQPVSAEAGAAPAMAGESLAALIRYARGPLGLPRLVAAVDQPNARSHRLMQRCGFAAMGRTSGPADELLLYNLPLREAEAPRLL